MSPTITILDCPCNNLVPVLAYSDICYTFTDSRTDHAPVGPSLSMLCVVNSPAPKEHWTLIVNRAVTWTANDQSVPVLGHIMIAPLPTHYLQFVLQISVANSIALYSTWSYYEAVHPHQRIQTTAICDWQSFFPTHLFFHSIVDHLRIIYLFADSKAVDAREFNVSSLASGLVRPLQITSMFFQLMHL